jgi:hypothetical protein
MMIGRGKYAVHTLRLISLFSFLLVLSYLLVNIELDAFDPGAFKNVGIFLIALVGEILINLSDVFTGLGGDAGANVSKSVIRTMIYYVLLGGMDLSDYNMTAEEYISGEAFPSPKIFASSLGSMVMLILLPIALLSGLGFLRDCNVRLSVICFFSLSALLAIAVAKEKIELEYDTTSESLGELVTSPLFFLGLILLFYLEISFQASYAYTILEPNLKRSERIRQHIQRIKEFSETEEIGPLKEEKREETTETAKRKSIESWILIREQIEERRVAKPRESVRVNIKLKHYLESLLRNNPDAQRLLSAETARPKSGRILLFIIPNFVIRLSIVVFLSWIVLRPIVFLRAFHAPDPLLDSVESLQPETTFLVLIPLVLAIIIFSGFIGTIQEKVHKNVLKQVREEEKEKEEIEKGTTMVFTGTGTAPSTIETDGNS